MQCAGTSQTPSSPFLTKSTPWTDICKCPPVTQLQVSTRLRGLPLLGYKSYMKWIGTILLTAAAAPLHRAWQLCRQYSSALCALRDVTVLLVASSSNAFVRYCLRNGRASLRNSDVLCTSFDVLSLRPSLFTVACSFCRIRRGFVSCADWM